VSNHSQKLLCSGSVPQAPQALIKQSLAWCRLGRSEVVWAELWPAMDIPDRWTFMGPSDGGAGGNWRGPGFPELHSCHSYAAGVDHAHKFWKNVRVALVW
jgi:hypothetical protein